jgi:hypothetical protein
LGGHRGSLRGPRGLFFVKEAQKIALRSFRGVGRNDTGSWKNIFAYLLKKGGEVRGRSHAENPELKKKIEKFAKGKVAPDMVDKACEEFSVSPEAIELLARALSKPPEEIPE